MAYRTCCYCGRCLVHVIFFSDCSASKKSNALNQALFGGVLKRSWLPPLLLTESSGLSVRCWMLVHCPKLLRGRQLSTCCACGTHARRRSWRRNSLMSACLVGALNAGWSARFSRSAASMLLLPRYIYIYICMYIFRTPQRFSSRSVARRLAGYSRAKERGTSSPRGGPQALQWRKGWHSFAEG